MKTEKIKYPLKNKLIVLVLVVIEIDDKTELGYAACLLSLTLQFGFLSAPYHSDLHGLKTMLSLRTRRFLRSIEYGY